MDWKHCSQNIHPVYLLSEAKAWRRAGNVTKQNPEESNSLGPKQQKEEKTPRMHREQRVLGEQEIRKEGGRDGKDHTE